MATAFALYRARRAWAEGSPVVAYTHGGCEEEAEIRARESVSIRISPEPSAEDEARDAVDTYDEQQHRARHKWAHEDRD